MSADSSWELQQAIYGALTGDSTLMALITGTTCRKARRSPTSRSARRSAVAWGAVGVVGIETTLVLHVWTRSRGRKEAKLVIAEMHRIPHDADLTVPGHHLVWLRFEFSQTLLDADGATYHGMARYNAVTHQA